MSFQTDFDVKERVRSASDIIDVVGRDLELRPQGRHFVARCPFHNDKRPSMTVNQERQSWKCWVCDIGGDVFSFVMQREGLDFPGALALLAERAGIELPKLEKGPRSKPGDPNDKSTLMAAIESVAQAYYEQLAHGKSDDAKAARDYLAARGINDTQRKKFRIGFAPDSWEFAVGLLKSQKYSEAVAVACGAAIARDSSRGNSTGCYDRFRGRLMFPISNAQGKTISLGGRVIPAIAERTAAAKGKDSGGAKYINGPETMLFRKSNELYGLDLARDSIRGAGEVLVMEGYTDVVAASLAGIDRAVAVLGTALTEAHVRILKRFASRVVLVLDGDEAGKRRAEEVLDLFVTADADLRILTLPNDTDPADFLQQNSAADLLDLAKNSPDAIDHKIARLTDGVDVTRDTHQATSAIETMLQLFTKVPAGNDRAELKIDQLLMRMSQTFGLPVDRLQRRLESLRAEVKQREAKRSRYQKRAASPRETATPSPASPSTDAPDFDPFADAAMEDAAMFGIDDAPSVGAGRKSIAGRKPSSATQNSAQLSGIDRELFETLIESPEVAAMAIETIDPDWLRSNTAKMLLSAYQSLDLEGHDLSAESLLTLVENDFLKSQIISLQSRVDARNQPDVTALKDSPRERYAVILTRFHEREFEAEKSRQIAQLQTAALPEDEELAMLEQLFAAERLRQNPR